MVSATLSIETVWPPGIVGRGERTRRDARAGALHQGRCLPRIQTKPERRGTATRGPHARAWMRGPPPCTRNGVCPAFQRNSGRAAIRRAGLPRCADFGLALIPTSTARSARQAPLHDRGIDQPHQRARIPPYAPRRSNATLGTEPVGTQQSHELSQHCHHSGRTRRHRP